EPYDLVTFHGLQQAERVGARVVFFTWQNLQRRLPPPFTLFQHAVFRKAAGALAGNAEAAGILRARGWRGPTELLPQFGVDESVFAPAQFKRPDDGVLRIGYAGRLVPEKGLPTLLE